MRNHSLTNSSLDRLLRSWIRRWLLLSFLLFDGGIVIITLCNCVFLDFLYVVNRRLIVLRTPVSEFFVDWRNSTSPKLGSNIPYLMWIASLRSWMNVMITYVKTSLKLISWKKWPFKKKKKKIDCNKTWDMFLIMLLCYFWSH